MSFLEDYHAGRAAPEDIHDHIGAWHDDPNPFGPKLFVHLGMNWKQYKRWAETGRLPEPGDSD